MKKKNQQQNSATEAIDYLFKNYFIQNIKFKIECEVTKDGFKYDINNEKIAPELSMLIATIMLADSVNDTHVSNQDLLYHAGHKFMREFEENLGTYRNWLFEQLHESLVTNN